MKYKKLHFAKLLISLEENTITATEKYHPKEAAKDKYIECI